MTLPEIAAEARRMAASYREAARLNRERGDDMPANDAEDVASDFDRLAEMAEGRAAPQRLGYGSAPQDVSE